ncbi:hypothetical protein [Mesoterricola silvestris]|uniref:Uncharacterized protein n=1 Tax=Mesoterricola silvestris TaxID=2927979 RepID=A0AA48GYP1_9BACT|nr:hypothetical protein [Mesoterricola silvestris]BDU72793.1 hypothetical protein METEAL_19670 [Mesoterricola silvestris]
MFKPLLPLLCAALGAAAPHPVQIHGCVGREGLLRAAATRNLPRYRRLVKIANADGTYRCSLEIDGWSLKDVLAAFKPAKKTDDGYDRPLDTFIVVTGRDGRKALFAWSELFLAGDGGPLLAEKARFLLPHHHDPLGRAAVDPIALQPPAGRDALKLESCASCHGQGKLLALSMPKGLCLVFPQDGFGGRFVEDVAEVEIRQVGVQVTANKAAGKKALVETPELVGPDGARVPLDAPRFQAAARAAYRDAAFGEGMGFHGLRVSTGADLGALLKPLLPPGLDPRSTCVLVTAADGYRSVYSGTEVFDGRGAVLADRINGEELPAGSGRYHVVPRGDFYIDRDVRIVKEIRILTPLR